MTQNKHFIWSLIAIGIFSGVGGFYMTSLFYNNVAGAIIGSLVSSLVALQLCMYEFDNNLERRSSENDNTRSIEFRNRNNRI